MKKITFNLNDEMSIISGQSRAKVINAYNKYFNFVHPVKIELGVVKEQLFNELHMLYIFNNKHPNEYENLLEDIYTIGVMHNNTNQSYPLTIDTKLIITLKDSEKTKKEIVLKDFIKLYGANMFNGANINFFTEFEVVGEEECIK